MKGDSGTLTCFELFVQLSFDISWYRMVNARILK